MPDDEGAEGSKAGDGEAEMPEVDEERTVIVDANALMMQFQYYVDLEQELKRVIPGAYEVLVPSSVVVELEGLTEKEEGKAAEEARLAIELANTFEIVETDEDNGDEAIIDLASDIEGSVVVTNDKLLRARLRAKGIPNVHMRSKAFLSVEGFPGF